MLYYYLIGIGCYLSAAMILGILGRNRKMGAWGYFFGSIVLTPLLGLILLLASDPKAHRS